MDCKHPQLIRIVNMPDGTYKCGHCGELVNVTFGPVKQPVVVMGTQAEGEDHGTS